jgi:hypothetical protein
MTTYLDILPVEIQTRIYNIYLVGLIHSDEFKHIRVEFLYRRLRKTLSQKQLCQLGL